MYLIENYQKSAITLNLSTKNEYVWIRGESKITLSTKLVLTNVLLILTLLNVRSCKKHVFDVLKDTSLLQNDVLDLTQMFYHFLWKFNLTEKKTKVLQ